MDEEMKKCFFDMFICICNEFGIVFFFLFGGGKVDLKLIDLKDLLNIGVEIVV